MVQLEAVKKRTWTTYHFVNAPQTINYIISFAREEKKKKNTSSFNKGLSHHFIILFS